MTHNMTSGTEAVKTHLHSLCNQGDLKGMHWVLSKFQADINYVNNWGDTLLGAAYRHSYWHIFEYILAHTSFDANKHDLRLYLYDAAEKGYLTPVQLLSGFCSSNHLNKALVVACSAGHLTVVAWLVSATTASVNYCDDLNLTPLSAAIGLDRWNVANYLIANTNVALNAHQLQQYLKRAAGEGSVDKIQAFSRFLTVELLNECLLTSSLFGQVSVVQWLLKNTRASFQFADELGFTPLTAACNQGHWNVLNCFIEARCLDLSNSDTWAYMLSLIASKTIPEVSVRAAVNLCTSEQRNEALMHACMIGSAKLTEWLITETQADVNFMNNSCCDTPVTVACKACHWHIVSYLVNTPLFDPSNHGLAIILAEAASRDSTEEFDILALFVDEADLNDILYDASKYGRLNIVRWLALNTNADVNFTRNVKENINEDVLLDNYDHDYDLEVFLKMYLFFHHKYTTVSIACRNNNWDAVKILVKSSKFVDRCHDLWLMMLIALVTERENELKLFAQKCTDKETINDIMIFASKRGNLAIVQWLMSACGADINHRSNRDLTYGETCLTVACNEENWNIVKYILQLPTINRNVHELCEYLFEMVDEGRFNENDLKVAFFHAKTLYEYYDDSDEEELWEALDYPEE